MSTIVKPYLLVVVGLLAAVREVRHVGLRLRVVQQGLANRSHTVCS